MKTFMSLGREKERRKTAYILSFSPLLALLVSFGALCFSYIDYMQYEIITAISMLDYFLSQRNKTSFQVSRL